jgi:tetratricopeptide (TPR) repeat protein
MDGAAFLFWLSLGVFDNHWKDIPLQVLFVCLIISYLFLLVVAAMFGLAERLKDDSEKSSVRILMHLGTLIDGGWDKALQVGANCSMVVLSLLVAACLAWWRDLMWWTEMSRGLRAETEHRSEDATKFYQSALDIGTKDRIAVSQVMLANVAFDRQELLIADLYFNQAIATADSTRGDNRNLIVTAYQGLVKTLLLEKKYKEAEIAARKCLAVYAKNKTPLPPIYLRLLGDVWLPSNNAPPTLMGTYTLLEEACVSNGQFEDAKKTFADNLVALRGSKESTASEIIAVTNLYVDLLAGVKPIRLEMLNDAVEQAQTTLTQKYGDNCAAIVELETRYGDRLQALGYPEQAESRYLKAIQVAEADKVENFIVLRAMNGLASIYVSSNRLDLADATYKKEIALRDTWKKSSSDDDIEMNTCRADYAALLRKLNRGDEADRIQSASSGKVRQD